MQNRREIIKWGAAAGAAAAAALVGGSLVLLPSEGTPYAEVLKYQIKEAAKNAAHHTGLQHNFIHGWIPLGEDQGVVKDWSMSAVSKTDLRWGNVTVAFKDGDVFNYNINLDYVYHAEDFPEVSSRS